MNTIIRRIRHALIPAAAVMLFGIGGAAQADSYRLYFGSPGVSLGFKSGHYGHYGHRGYSPRRHHYKHHYKHHYRAYPRYWHGPRYGYYKHGYRHPGRYYGYKRGYRGHKHGYRGHRRHGWRH